MSQIITFYSYKGGVGRSMALANVAVLLSRWGFRVLMIDWDLEAPGLQLFFEQHADIASMSAKPGLIEILTGTAKYEETLCPISVRSGDVPIHLIQAGRRDENYYDKVRRFDHDAFYEQQDGGQLLEDLRAQWLAAYDFVLVDSRTGVTDIGGICTIQLPDILVLLFTTTEQGFRGAIDVAQRADRARQSLPFERLKLLTLPVLSRFEPTEYKLSRQWVADFASRLTRIYEAWLPQGTNPDEFLLETKVPYIPYFSFGEQLAVVEQDVRDPTGLGYAYETMSALLANGLADADALLHDRLAYVERVRRRSPLDSPSPEFTDRSVTPLRVFVSSTHRDRPLKELLLTRLSVIARTIGVVFWHDADLMPGEQWEVRINEEIDRADVYLVLVTPAYQASASASAELERIIGQVLAHGKRVIPLSTVAMNDNLGGVFAILRRFLVLELTSSESSQLERAVEAIQRVLAIVANGRAPINK